MKNLSKEELLSRLEAINRSNAIIYFDLEGYILGMNSIFLKAMGYQEEDHKQLVGKHHSIFVSYEYSKSDDYKKFWATLRGGKFFEGEFERKKMDGAPIFLQATYNPIFDENNNITKVMKIATDISETVNFKNKIDALSKDLQLELDKSQQLKNAIEIEKNAALNDLDILMKKSQSELIKTIVVVALVVIVGVGVITTILYWMAIVTNRDTQIIGSTWSNMFSVLLTNAFSIVGTIMGIKYATQDGGKEKK
ncbi:MAG: PAS domain S-box protein [Dehalococcoidia bacterium]|nr:MAG: PAS domain S-box protein [Dehalococcoidia bacterium]